MAIMEGSLLRIEFYFRDRDGELMDLSEVQETVVRIKKGHSKEVLVAPLSISPTVQGLAIWEGLADSPGRWLAMGNADGYLSEPTAWVVTESPIPWP